MAVVDIYSRSRPRGRVDDVDELDELQKATEDLLLFGARSILADAPDYTWNEARDRLGIDEATFKRAVTVFYGLRRRFRPGQRPVEALTPLRPEPGAMALLPNPKRPTRPGAALFRDPWQIVELDRPELRPLIDMVERMSIALDEQIKAWAAAGPRPPLLRGLLQAGQAFRAARISLAKPVFGIADRRLTEETDLLPATNLKFPDELYLADIRLCCDRIHATVRSGKDQFMGDVDAQDAVMRRLEIIGEAAKKLSAEFTEQHDSTRWSEIIGLRVILAHFLVTNVPDVERIWE